jgi:predicted signal transduction protein with EAL and GGDEF domain
MLRAYLMMVRERLVLHCTLARVYPDLPPPPPEHVGAIDRLKRALVRPAVVERTPWTDDARFVSVELAAAEVRGKIDGFAKEIAAAPALDDVYQPMMETLQRRLGDLARLHTHDAHMSAQLQVFPDQFDVIVSKLATPQADVGEVVGEMKLLLEQTDETVSFVQDLRAVS